MNGLHVLKPGMLSLIQDGGRQSSYALGLTDGGPLDRFAFDAANELLDNYRGAAAVEITLGGFEAEAIVRTCFCLCGAENPLTINNRPVPRWTVHELHPGDRISVGLARAGCRSYLAVAGGFDVPKQFGSAATVVREGAGGLNGQALGPGDLIPCSPATTRTKRRQAQSRVPEYPNELIVRVVPGYQHDAFSQTTLDRFFDSEYRVSTKSNRMGYLLEGPQIKPPTTTMLSEGICHGAIQIPPDGQPIVLLADRQTIGGYPKIGSAIATDCWKLAQLQAGGCVRFAPITPDMALKSLR